MIYKFLLLAIFISLFACLVGAQTQSSRTKRFAELYDMVDLRDESLAGGDSEMRVWVGFGAFRPRNFTFVDHTNSAQAFFISGAPDDSGKGVLRKKIELTMDGLAAFRSYLNEEQFWNREFQRDTKHVWDPDEEVIIVELRNGPHYKSFYYPVRSESESGKAIISFVKQIEARFCVSLLLQGNSRCETKPN